MVSVVRTKPTLKPTLIEQRHVQIAEVGEDDGILLQDVYSSISYQEGKLFFSCYDLEFSFFQKKEKKRKIYVALFITMLSNLKYKLINKYYLMAFYIIFIHLHTRQL